ncbi:DUF445 family protein [Spirochaeta cellobiosiphila]|uniref:DUF445 family protein n=1 Tax=Spirochaeta cellobiosiphila TaxID=504483 RepID=UPI000426D6B5|nr:DUF445 family protein [Spirochaeta cellobiosiphila]
MEWITYVLPPLLGAIIGYVTNALAIKMLFRPFTKKKIFGIPLPFTPGIIPRQRESLARNIGKMVSEKLLTEEVLSKHLEGGGFEATVHEQVSQFTTQILSTDLGQYLQGNGDWFKDFLTQADTRKWISERINILIQNWEDDKIIDLLKGFDPHQDSQTLTNTLIHSNIWYQITEVIRDRVLLWIKEDYPLDRIIGDDKFHKVQSLLGFLWEPLGHLVLYLLSQDKTRQDLALRGRFFIQDVLQKLNTMQKFFVSAAQYDKTLHERMPDIIEDFISQAEMLFKDGEQKSLFLQNMNKYWEEYKGKTIAQIIGKDKEDLVSMVMNAHERILNAITSEGPQNQLYNMVHSVVNKLTSTDIKSLIHLFYGKDYQVLSEHLSRRITTILADNQNKGGFHLELKSWLPNTGSLKETVDNQLTKGALSLVRQKAPQALASLNLQALVEDRINTLDIEQVEELLLIVIKKHLRYINLFGALLGGVIGGSQVLLKLLGY